MNCKFLCANMNLHYSFRSLFHHSFHEFPCHLWGLNAQHQRGMLWGMYHPTQLAKWRQVLLHVYTITLFMVWFALVFFAHWAWILCAEKLSGSNAFCSRTIRGLNHNPCFNGIWQEFCQTSPSAGQKWRECGDKHPTGGTVPLIPSINKRWIIRNWWWKATPQQVLMWGLEHSCDHPWVFQLLFRVIFLTLTLIFRYIHFSAGVNRSMRIRSLYKLL